MLLDRILKFLIYLYSIEKINDALCNIYDFKMVGAAIRQDRQKVELFEELSGCYDEINRMLQVRPFRDKPVKTQ